jgi:hypothetical protein
LWISPQAQTGPAGVQSSATNVFWVKADAGTSSTTNNAPISSWNDQSGNGINVSQATANQQPLYVANVLNGFPAIQFDNTSTTNDKMTAPDNSLLDNTSGYTFFMVTRPQTVDNNARCIVSKRTTVGVDQSFMHFFFTGGNLYSDIQTTNDRYNTTVSFAANTNYIFTQQFDGALAAASRCRTYVGSNLNVTATESSNFVPDNASPLLIGSTDASDARPFGGYIAEIIMYRTALSAAPRIIVENYLSAKYNITLSANDKYVGDDVANGDYDREVAGLGQESGSASSSFSPATCAGFGCSAISGLDNTDYLLAGNNSAANSIITTDVSGMTGTNNSRWQRIWYIDITNTSTNITADLSFDFSAAGLTAPTFGWPQDYVLLYRAGQSGSWTELSTASGFSGDNILFDNTVVTSDGYYTLGTKNFFASPLPLELLELSAKPNIHSIDVFWKTATEHKTDSFSLDYSFDAIHFLPCAKIKAAGESSEQRKYTFTHRVPQSGVYYYRLSAIDQDGSVKSYPLISAETLPEREWNIHPNPTDDELIIESLQTDASQITIELIDIVGRSVLNTSISPYQTQVTISLKSLNLGAGIYYLKIKDDAESRIYKIILK